MKSQNPILILTPFALRLTGSNNSWSADWLEFRLDVLERFTAPSVVSQEFQDFTWCLFLDESLADLEDRLFTASLGRGMPIIVRESEGPEVAVRNLLTAPTMELLSVRLDSDDLIAPSFMSRVVELNQPDRVLTFPRGAGLILETIEGFGVTEVSNSFLSYRSKKGESVWSLGSHNEQWKTGELQIVRTSTPMWCRLIHHSNIANARAPHHRSIPSRELTNAFPSLLLEVEKLRPVESVSIRNFNVLKFLMVHAREFTKGLFSLSRRAFLQLLKLRFR